MTTRRLIALFGLSLAAFSNAASAQSVESGRFGRAVKVGAHYAAADHAPVYIANPLTVELFARVNGKADVSVLLSNEPRRSKHHWELYTEKETGRFAVSIPGYTPATLVSSVDIADDQWHHVAFVLDGGTARLYVDGKQALEQAVKQTKPYPDTGPLLFGHQPGVAPHADTQIDEVRISRVARKFEAAPDKPCTADADTLGLWHFDEDAAAVTKQGGYIDASAIANIARPKQLADAVADSGGFDNSVGGKTRWSDMDFGPFFSSTITPPLDKSNVTHKGISIRLGKEKKHAVTFDTELLRMSAAWEGDFIKLNPGREGLSGPPTMGATPILHTSVGPGWIVGDPAAKDAWADPRPSKSGTLTGAKYSGLYRSIEGNVVLSYTVGGTQIIEEPGIGPEGLDRSFEVAPSEQPLCVLVCEVPGAVFQMDGVSAVARMGDQHTAAFCSSSKEEVELRAIGSRVVAFVRPHKSLVSFAVSVWVGSEVQKEAVLRTWTRREAMKKLLFEKKGETKIAGAISKTESLRLGAPAQYPPIVTQGQLGKPDSTYIVDTLTAPDDNPWKSFLRFGGHDFFANGDCAVCSVSGDVWVVSGIDDKLEKLTWRRFATGLFQPLGLKVIDDKVYVLGRDQITRLHDLNNDGEADFYENFNNDGLVTTNGHAYVCCLERGPDGSLYYIKCGDRTPHGGTILKISPDGKKIEPIADGVRNANGLGMGPNGLLSFADNQGDWVPASRIDLVTQPLQFLGYTPMRKLGPPATGPGRPIVWMPQNVDNSSGGQVWVEGDKWGLPAGTMLHTSYGQASLLHVMPQQVKLPDGTTATQAFVHKFPLTFQTGIMRGRFRPQDGQLYVSGLRGWQTAGTRDGALQRVRYNPAKPNVNPVDVKVTKAGIAITFGSPLDAELANDVGSWSVLTWNYRWHAEYGSKFYSVKDPNKQGVDTLEVKKATLQPDGKTVVLEVPDLKPAMQVRVTCNLETKDGQTIRTDLYGTLYGVGE
jgi:hypothetical protein